MRVESLGAAGPAETPRRSISIPDHDRPPEPFTFDGPPAFLFGLFIVFLLGGLLRVPRFADPATGLLFSVLADSGVALLLLANQTLHRWAWTALSRPGFIAVLIVSSVASAVCSGLAASAFSLLHPAFQPPYASQKGPQLIYFSALFLAWGVAGAWLRDKSETGERLLRAAAAERAAVQAEMRRLRMQLDPHFLFNALNTIAVEIPDHPRRAVATIHELSHYLRHSLDTADQTLVPVRSEVAALRSFLRVQKARFGPRLATQLRLGPGMRGWSIPSFLLQPLIENATKHGVPGAHGVLEIRISVVEEKGALLVSVANSGDLDSGTDRSGTGTGLANLRRRLELHYPGRHDFSIVQDGPMVSAKLRLEGAPC